MKNIKLKLLMIVLVMFSCTSLFSIYNTKALYREAKSTTINLSVVDSSADFVVTLMYNDGTGNYRNETREYNEELGNVLPPSRTNYNFLGWYDSNNNRIYPDQLITSNVTYYAHWQEIVCKKVTSANNLHTETCAANGGCLKSGTGYSNGSIITYGTIYGDNSPLAGDAYDCDVNYDGTYDSQTQHGKFTERFYYIRKIDNGSDEPTAALVYYTSIDANGPVDSQNNDSIGSNSYPDALDLLPLSSSWDNPNLIDFDSNNGKISRFPTLADIESVCGSPITLSSIPYFTNCGKWFFFENSRFQSGTLGRSGIWLEYQDNHYYRIHTSSVNVAIPDNGVNSANMTRPVIEIPYTALEGYRDVERFTISFDTHGGTPIASFKRNDGEAIGTIPETTKENYEFVGWFAEFSNDEYSVPVDSTTLVTGDMTLHAKWNQVATYEVTFDANGGTINGESTFKIDVNTGSTINEEDYPEAIFTGKYFDEWYTEPELTNVFDKSTPITSAITLFAGWTDTLYVAKVNNTKYTTLAEAISNVPTGTSASTRVTILHDITLTSTVSIPTNKWVEIDGGSYTIDGDVNLITNNGKLDIISGNYVINTTTESRAYPIILNKSTATLNISGGDFTSTVTKQGDFSVVENTGGTIYVSGGHLECHAQSAVINHKSNGNLYISGGELIGTNTTKGQAIYIENGAKAYISGDAYLENVSAASGGNARAAVDNNGGTLEITGGTIVSKAFSAVMSRNTNAVTTIGIEDTEINITTPVMRGERYGLEKTSGTVKVYDGLFESFNQTVAISDTNVTKPSNTIFKTNETILIDNKSYHKAFLYATSYTVDFLPENGESTISITVPNGEEIGQARMPQNPTRENYYFEGWFIDGDLLYPVTYETVVDGYMNVKAVWTPTIKLATIPETLNVSLGYTNTISITDIPEGMESYTFETSDDQVATVDANGVVSGVGLGTVNIIIRGAKSNLTVEVEVEVSDFKYTVTFKDDDNSTVTSVGVAPGNTVGSQMPADLVRTNYIFKGWYVDGNINNSKFTSSTPVNSDITVIAVWRLELNSATVTITPDPLVFKKGRTGEISITSNNGVIEDCTFTSSDTSIATVSVDNTNSHLATVNGVELGTTTITIRGTDSNQTIPITVVINNLNNITFDPDNGGSVTTVQIADGSSIDSSGVTIPSNPTKNGYIFDAWYLYDGTSLTDTALDTSKTITDDEVYKASWAPVTAYAGIGPHYYPSIQDAIDSVTTNAETEIKILQDIPATVGQTIIPSGRNIVLNGGNYTVDCGTTAEKQLIYNSGTLRIKSGTYSCNISELAVLENNKSAHMYIDGGTIINYNDRGAIYIGGGTVDITGGELISSSIIRPVVYNAASGAVLNVSGGTILQEITGNVTIGGSGRDDGRGAIKVTSGSTANITGGTIISTASNSAAIYAPSGTLVIGTKNDAYDVTTPVIQGENYGIDANIDYAIYDGIIKGKTNNRAVNNVAKITGKEDDSTIATGQDGDFYTLYYTMPLYHVTFNPNDGEVSPTEKDFNLNETINTSDLPTPIRGAYTFDGWYLDSGLQNPFVPFAPSAEDDVTYYAKWTFNSTTTPVEHNVLSDAMVDYFDNVSNWVADDATDPSNDPPREASQSNNYDNGHHLFKDSIDDTFTSNGCSPCGADNSCSNPQAGTYCDQQKEYDTGLTDSLNVYLFENGQKGAPVTYTTSTNGKIYNMIPGVTYYWESATDNTKYGVVTATGSRRTLKTAVRNLRDLGGLSVSYEDLSTHQMVSGTIEYGMLYRGAQITSAQGVTDLEKLGVVREIDLRQNGEGEQSYKMDYYDTGTSSSYDDIIMTNYIVNPEITPFITSPYLSNYRGVKSALRKAMEAVVFGHDDVAHDSIFFHCTIGTDRTGTLAYFLEGLLGVSEEDRLRDYELTYFFGLTNRTRFHDSVSWSSIKPRFYSMYRSYPSNADIYAYYKYEAHVPDPSNPNDLSDDDLLTAFRNVVIKKN